MVNIKLLLKIVIYYKLLLLTLCVLFSGCHLIPFYSFTEVAFVVIHNETGKPFDVQEGLSERLGERFTTGANERKFFYRYEQSSKNENFPKLINIFTFYFDNCVLVMNRQAIEKYAKRPPDGRLGWDIIVNQDTIDDLGCKEF